MTEPFDADIGQIGSSNLNSVAARTLTLASARTKAEHARIWSGLGRTYWERQLVNAEFAGTNSWTTLLKDRSFKAARLNMQDLWAKTFEKGVRPVILFAPDISSIQIALRAIDQELVTKFFSPTVMNDLRIAARATLQEVFKEAVARQPQQNGGWPEEYTALIEEMVNDLPIEVYPMGKALAVSLNLYLLGGEHDLELGYHYQALLKTEQSSLSSRDRQNRQTHVRANLGRVRTEADFLFPRKVRYYFFKTYVAGGAVWGPTIGNNVNMYDKTIDARVTFWRTLGKAPVWLLLQYGTKWEPRIQRHDIILDFEQKFQAVFMAYMAQLLNEVFRATGEAYAYDARIRGFRAGRWTGTKGGAAYDPKTGKLRGGLLEDFEPESTKITRVSRKAVKQAVETYNVSNMRARLLVGNTAQKGYVAFTEQVVKGGRVQSRGFFRVIRGGTALPSEYSYIRIRTKGGQVRKVYTPEELQRYLRKGATVLVGQGKRKLAAHAPRTAAQAREMAGARTYRVRMYKGTKNEKVITVRTPEAVARLVSKGGVVETQTAQSIRARQSRERAMRRSEQSGKARLKAEARKAPKAKTVPRGSEKYLQASGRTVESTRASSASTGTKSPYAGKQRTGISKAAQARAKKNFLRRTRYVEIKASDPFWKNEYLSDVKLGTKRKYKLVNVEGKLLVRMTNRELLKLEASRKPITTASTPRAASVEIVTSAADFMHIDQRSVKVGIGGTFKLGRIPSISSLRFPRNAELSFRRGPWAKWKRALGGDFKGLELNAVLKAHAPFLYGHSPTKGWSRSYRLVNSKSEVIVRDSFGNIISVEPLFVTRVSEARYKTLVARGFIRLRQAKARAKRASRKNYISQADARYLASIAEGDLSIYLPDE